MTGDDKPPQRRRAALLSEALRRHRPVAPVLFWIWIACSAVVVVLPLVSLVFMGRLIGAIPDGREQVLRALVVVVAVQLIQVPFMDLKWGLVQLIGERYRLAHRERLMTAALQPAGVAHLHEPRVLDAARAADNVWVVNMLEGVMNVAVERAIGAGSALVVLWHAPLAGVLMAGAWLVVGRWNWRYSTAVHEVVTGQTQALRRAGALADLAITPPAAKELRIFGLRGWLSARYAQEWWAAMSNVWRQRASARNGAWAMAVLLLGAHLVALVLVVDAARDGRMSLAGLAMVLAATHQMRELGEGVWGLYELEFGVPIVAALGDFERLVADRAEPLPGDAPAPAPRETIRFEGVRFRYPGAERDVLTGVDLELPVGRSTAIVGVNGVGKTTLVHLLSRLRDPTSGRITVDGMDLCAIHPRAWQARFAAVFQHALRLPLSAADNVAAGRPRDDALLSQSASGAGAADVVAGLRRGWETPLSRELADGADLSGGQWQRIALARGLYAVASGADVLVLDEPTAHLDVRAEADLYDRFLELTRGHTTVLVSHRFSTVRRADRIVVLEDGRVVEEGNHDSLVASGGRYAEMFELQASRFAADVAPALLEDE